MPEMGYTEQSTAGYNDKSELSEGWHPGYLICISDEETPATWKMAAQSPRMWKWHFALWEMPSLINRQPPEHQSAPSSQKFTPRGTQPASKAYSWTAALLGRQIQPGERVNLDPMMPIPCRCKVERSRNRQEYVNVIDVEAWQEGTQYLTPEFRAELASIMQPKAPTQPQNAYTPPPVTQQPTSQPPQPGMQSWGQPAPQPVTTGKPPW